MTALGIMQIVVFFALLLLVAKPLGSHIARVAEGRRTFLHPVLGPVERSIYRLAGVRSDSEQRWTQYAVSLLAFSLTNFILLYALQRIQGLLPLNPQRFTAVPPDLAFNTAVSFMTNTDWQSYAGESTLGYLVQMAGLTVQNFVSAAAGIAVAIALIRGFARQKAAGIGNFWADLTRVTLYLLVPLSVAFALVLCSQGVIQNFSPYQRITTLEGTEQVIAQGPVASQEAIKELGTNGGGFFNANSSHPYENPTPLTNYIEALLILLIPAALPYTFGKMIGDIRQGRAVFTAMGVMFLAGALALCWAEQSGNPILAGLGIETTPSASQAGGNMEGKEVRFGIVQSALFADVTTSASCGAVDGMHDSFTPIGGLVALFNMQTGEVIFGGVG